ncbi:hypothetical protein [Accumulibacter sp.]|uniref:hypothetical protein n=1 Tax=Accumulibacter sp. TaxID=2053492 RepID=UPI0026177902|nr:hypothetical protein [Accumulibacter sp.]
MATLTQYWTDEVSRLDTALRAEQAAVVTLGNALAAAQAAQRSSADAARQAADDLAAARRELAAIPMPADGDPLLRRMEEALIGLATANDRLADGELAVQRRRAGLSAHQERAAELTGELDAARRALVQASQDAAERASMADALISGSLAGLAADAAAALGSFGADARARVEGEFPASGTAEKDFLKRVRARRAIVEASVSSAAAVEAAAFTASHDAVGQAQRAFDAARRALAARFQAASALAADTATLERLAALPVALPPTRFPILTPWQQARLHDAGRQSARESALVKLKAVDDAQLARRAAQASYDQALYAALKADPDATLVQLEATTLSAARAALDGKAADLASARAALDAGERSILQSWLAAVPDTLWEALDSLDGALARLTLLQGPPTSAALLAELDSAEAALAGALSAARLAQRKVAAASAAHWRASADRLAESETQRQRATAVARSASLY